MRKACPNVHVSHPTTNKKHFMEEDRFAMKVLQKFRNGEYKEDKYGRNV